MIADIAMALLSFFSSVTVACVGALYCADAETRRQVMADPVKFWRGL